MMVGKANDFYIKVFPLLQDTKENAQMHPVSSQTNSQQIETGHEIDTSLFKGINNHPQVSNNFGNY